MWDAVGVEDIVSAVENDYDASLGMTVRNLRKHADENVKRLAGTLYEHYRDK